MKAVIFDIDGTLCQGGAALPGAVATVRGLRRRGTPLRFVTNTTSKSRAQLAAMLDGFDIPAEPEEIHSPPFAAGRFLVTERATAWLVMPDQALEDFAGVTTTERDPDYVVLADVGERWNFALINGIFRTLHSGARLVGLGRARYWQAADGLRLDAGPFIAAFEYATDREALIIGKPEPGFFLEAVADLGCRPEDVLMVGDDIRTDVQAAMHAGLRGVLVKSGKFRAADLDAGIVPHRVLDSVADVLDAL